MRRKLPQRDRVADKGLMNAIPGDGRRQHSHQDRDEIGHGQPQIASGQCSWQVERTTAGAHRLRCKVAPGRQENRHDVTTVVVEESGWLRRQRERLMGQATVGGQVMQHDDLHAQRLEQIDEQILPVLLALPDGRRG